MAITVSYNGESLPNVYGSYQFSHDYRSFTFSCNFQVDGSSAANLISQCNDIEEKLREPFEDLVVGFGGANDYSLSHDDNTYLLSSPEISIIDDNNTETTRTYNFKVTAFLPADKSGFNFRREASFDIKKDQAGKRMVVFSLTYTAGDSSSSLENFDAHAETYCESVLGNLDPAGAFEIVAINRSTEHEQKITQGSIAYKEVIDAETKGTFNTSAIVGMSVDYSTSFEREIGLSETAPELVQIPGTSVNIRFSASVDKDQVASDADFEAIYRTQVKPWIIEHSFAVLGLGNFAEAGASAIITADPHSHNRSNSTISGSISFLAPNSLTQIISLSEVITEEEDLGQTLIKLWDRKNYTYSKWEMGAERGVIRNISVRQLTAPVTFITPLGEGLVLRNRRRTTSPRRIGAGAEAVAPGISVGLDVFETSFQEVYTFVAEVAQEEGEGVPL